ncbi:MAG: HAD family hydrolase [bacterium]|nr:HAD family hydrolase [bacterium]
MKNVYILFDFAGTLATMRPATLLVNKSLLKRLYKTYLLGIITGAGKTEVINILNKLEIFDLFSLVISADDSKYKKPNRKLVPKVNILAYIGDSKKDETFAQNAKLAFFRVNKKYNINAILKELL